MDREQLTQWFYDNFNFVLDGSFIILIPKTELGEFLEESYQNNNPTSRRMFIRINTLSTTNGLSEFLHDFYNVRYRDIPLSIEDIIKKLL
jgi:hypothetical protein